MKNKISSIDEYIETFPQDIQVILQQVRQTIKAAAPKAGETISYGIPTFTLNGKYLIYFAGWKHHISIYPIPTGNDAFQQEITPYISGKGTLKFPIEKPIPLKLITKIVKLKVAENSSQTDKRNNGEIR
jgi:uncharacterized protein YdhG (YjbR/CyaY superfamily)